MLSTILALISLATAPPQTPRVYASPQSVSIPAPPPVYVPAVVVQGDQFGFGGWLNNLRARHGLRPLGFDPGLANDAAINNSHGFGHAFMGRARRQNAGMGPASMVWPMWTTSPAHMAALLDPTVTMYGIARNDRSIWTFNAY